MGSNSHEVGGVVRYGDPNPDTQDGTPVWCLLKLIDKVGQKGNHKRRGQPLDSLLDD